MKTFKDYNLEVNELHPKIMNSMVACGVVKSKSEIRQLMKEKAIHIKSFTMVEDELDSLVLKIGKKRFVRVAF